MSAVTQQRNGRDEHGENGHCQGHRGKAWLVGPVFGMLLEFLKFFGHFQTSLVAVWGIVRGEA
jgi:hypothetical protein